MSVVSYEPLLLTFVLFNVMQSRGAQTVEEFVKLIENGIDSSLNYVQKQNAHEYQPLDPSADPILYGTFDFIIIGGGASGSVLTSRLSENNKFEVLLLDAGHFEDDFIKIPGLMSYSPGTDFSWGLKSTPQQGACLAMEDSRCQLFRGRGIGGSTIVSPSIYARPLASDFTQWNEQVPGWGYEDVLPFFAKSENFSAFYDNDDDKRWGPLSVHTPDYTTPHIDAFLAANQELGYALVRLHEITHSANFTTSLDTGTRGVVSRVEANARNGRRLSVGGAYVAPHLDRPNLNVTTRSYVTKILFSGEKRVLGVEFYKDRLRYVANVRKEVVLSSGAISSPQILVQSGIGPRRMLRGLRIMEVKALENVGRNYQTHAAIFGLSVGTNASVGISPLEENVRLYLQGKGVYTMGGNRGAVGYYDVDGWSLEFVFLTANRSAGFYQSGYAFTPGDYDALTSNVRNDATFSVFISPRYPKSIGSVEVVSENVFDFPRVDPNLLSDRQGHDVEAIYQGILLLDKILETAAMRRLNATLKHVKLDGCPEFDGGYKMADNAARRRSYWYCVIRRTSDELFHPVGTNRMSKEEDAGVVDGEFKVFGVGGLRVADGSVVPYSMTGHTAAICVMIAERCSEIIKDVYFKGG